MRRIVLDIGHGSDTFPPSKGVYINKDTLSATEGKAWEEHYFNSEVAVKAMELLKDYNVEILLTQSPHAREVKLIDRTRLVNKWHKEKPIDFLISIHANAHLVNSPAMGYCSFHWQNDQRGKAFVSLWNKKMEKTNMKNRGAMISSRYGNNFHIIRESACSAVLLEHFFFTNYAELMQWGFSEGINILAGILAETIIDYFGLTKEKKTLTVNIYGEDKELDYIFQNNRNYVSIRELAEAMGAAVEWDHARKKLFILKGE